MSRALIVGYGNSLREDDGVGWHVANLLAGDARFAGDSVMATHQLTPELAEDMSQVDVAVFIDAQENPQFSPGHISLTEVHVDVTTPAEISSHHASPEALTLMASELYGHAPKVFLLGVTAASMETGEHLTPKVEAALGHVIDRVARLVERFPARA